MCRTENGMLIQKVSQDRCDFRRRGIISNSADSIQFNRCSLIAGVGKGLLSGDGIPFWGGEHVMELDRGGSSAAL